MQKVVWGLVLLLVILHQDFWFWENETLVFGFLPIGLAWHMGISIGAAITWFLATRYCWPTDDEALPDAPAVAPAGGTEEGGAR